MFNNNNNILSENNNASKFRNFASNAMDTFGKIPFDNTVTPLSWLILMFTFIACLFMF